MEIGFSPISEVLVDEIVKLDALCFDEPWGKQKFFEEVQNNDALVLGAFARDELLGAICVRVILDELWIFRIMTHPRARRQKIAQKLLAMATQIKGRALPQWLEVSVDNESAIRFYGKEGFEKQYIRKGYYVILGNPVDAVVMKREAL